jgi:hypothetical protein
MTAKLPTLEQLRIRHARLLKEQQELVRDMREVVSSTDDLTEQAERLVALVLAYDKRNFPKGDPDDCATPGA